MKLKKILRARKLQPHTRVNDSFFGKWEKQLLVHIAAKLPSWMTPDVLTSIGFLAGLLTGISYWLTSFNQYFLWLASFGFVLNWFGDSLDGTVARYRKIERPKFGYFIDHTLDALTQFIIIIGIGLSPYVDIKFALFFLVGYFMMSIQTYITTYVRGIFRLAYGKLGPTEVRVMAIIANCAVFFAGDKTVNLPALEVSIYELAFIITGSVLVIMFVYSTMKQAIELSGIE